MSVTIGDHLGSYEIMALLGKGGMGEVYRARDTKLKRDVAVKILPDEFSRDHDRVSRFQREAEVLASLNHPNIGAIYDLQEANGTRFLALELVEGETLADVLKRGQLPIDDAVTIARSICEALEAAHEKGVVHRDIKPANVKINSDGQVKVLDFGLAKALEYTPANSSISNSPTLSFAATNAGVILGTAAYMSPEQAKGKAVDRRSDIWSFGVVLYEMLTGQTLFSGETASETMAAVIFKEPEWNALPASTPSDVRDVLRRCLVKEPRNRLQAIGEARLMLSRPMEHEAKQDERPNSARTRKLPWAVAALCMAALIVLGLVHSRETPPVPTTLRFQIPMAGSVDRQSLTLSPDGRMLAFTSSEGGPTHLWIRGLDTLEPRPLAGADGATYPFWSPDATYLGFFQQGKLKKIAVAGGPPQTLCDAAYGRGGTWNRNGVVVFSPGPANELFRVPAGGGVPVPVTKLAGGTGHRFPSFLPDGVHFLYSATADNPSQSGVYVASLTGGDSVRILSDITNALYVPAAPGGGKSGYILFRRQNTLMAQPFDTAKLRSTGDATPVAESIDDGPNDGCGIFSVSENGILSYRSGEELGNRELGWFDRTGKKIGSVSKPGKFTFIALSPDEKTVAAEIGSRSDGDIWLIDLQRDVLSRFTFHTGLLLTPVWSPDGKQLAFSLLGHDSGTGTIYQKAAAGNRNEEVILHGGANAAPTDWSSDGKFIVYMQTGSQSASDLWLLPASASDSGNTKPVPYLQTPFSEVFGRLSPDGKWMAYFSNESGSYELYIQPVPSSGAKWQISTSPASVFTPPLWRRDGKELYYGAADQKVMAVPINLGSTVEAGTPQALFGIPGMYTFAASRDGQRFLVNAPANAQTAIPQVTIVTNWQSTLKK